MNQCIPVGYPETHAPFVPQAQTRVQDHPIPLLSRDPNPHPNLDSKPPYLRPSLSMVLRLPPFPVSQSVGPKRAGTHDKSVTSLFAPISKYVIRLISLWPDYHPQQRTVLNRHRRNNCNPSLARMPNQVQIQNTIPPSLQLSFIYIPCDSNVITIIISFLSLVSDSKSPNFYRNPKA